MSAVLSAAAAFTAASGCHRWPVLTVWAAYLPLGNLQSTLILANLQQLDDTLLIGGQASHLTHQVANELYLLAEELHQFKIRRTNTVTTYYSIERMEGTQVLQQPSSRTGMNTYDYLK